MKDGRGVKPATDPYSQRNVGNELFANGVLEETVEFLHCAVLIYFASLGNMESPPRLRAHFTVLPFEKVTRGQLLDAEKQGALAPNIVQGQVLLEGGHIQDPADLVMLEDRLHFRSEVQVPPAPAEIEGLNAHPVARQNQPSVGL